MEKPIVFFSHSTKDKKVLSHLKEIFYEKTGGSIDIFLSSDGQSIPLGRNWVHKVQEALEKAKIMFVFVTPNALGSSWMLFESGFAYAKGIRVVPIGFLGADIVTLSAPLSLLQGFNISSADGLDNLIALVNEEFSHRHTARFTNSEFESIISEAKGLSSFSLGEYTPFIKDIEIDIDERKGLKLWGKEAIDKIGNILKGKNVDFQLHDNLLYTYGLTVNTYHPTDAKQLTLRFDSSLAGITLPIAETILKTVMDNGVEGVLMCFSFYESIRCIKELFKASAKLYGSHVALGDKEHLRWRDLEFRTDRTVIFIDTHTWQERETRLWVRFKTNSLSIDSLRELVQLLFENEVLFIAR